MAMSVTPVGGGGCKFLPLYTSTLLLDRVSQNTIERRKIDNRQLNFQFHHQLIMQYGYLN